ncbi:hypothetical protein [Pseudoalteromonas luteoviolacea]|uniref:hypothetical protein n=1 Tax=Pseudoalteromonas luteoviolacea TaxID=43657 RepID=UPI001B36691C|nr:hypothetical protein [Pseudoalteromonas luteoviolacea]MBQ4837362.1 hypothetical protein [Pseudoalteromonas luteoviolacea]
MIRDIERIVIVIIAGISIYLGYRLFYLVKETQGKMKVSGGDYTIDLSDVGPGIYFAVFGSIILVSSLFSKVEKEAITTFKNGVVASEASRTIASVDDMVETTSLLDYESFIDVTYLNEEDAKFFSRLEKVAFTISTSSEEMFIKSSISPDFISSSKKEILSNITNESYKILLSEVETEGELYFFIQSYKPYFLFSRSQSE